MYGTGMRLMECLQLRVKDIDFDNHRILVYDGTGQHHAPSCAEFLAKRGATVEIATLEANRQPFLRCLTFSQTEQLRIEVNTQIAGVRRLTRQHQLDTAGA